MRRTIVLLLVVCFFEQIAVAFPAQTAEKLRHTVPVPAWKRIGRQALRQINWDWSPALEGWTIRLGPKRAGYNGFADKNARLISIWIRPTDSPKAVAGTIVHELAHAFDWKYLTPELRAKWLAVRGLPPDTPWYNPVGRLSSDYLSGAGDFAESVVWTLQGPGVEFRSCLGLQLSDAEKKHIAMGCRGLIPNEAQQALIRQWLAELPRTGGN